LDSTTGGRWEASIRPPKDLPKNQNQPHDQHPLWRQENGSHGLPFAKPPARQFQADRPCACHGGLRKPLS
jgi:hypothetical protein